MNLCEIDVCKSPLSTCRIAPRDFDLSGCGVPQVPENARYIDLYKTLAYSVVLGAAGSGTDQLFDEKKAVDSNADFYLHKITPLGTDGPNTATDYFCRFQWANGRYSSQVLQDVQTFLGVCYSIDPDGMIRCPRIPAGQFIGLQLQNFTNADVNVVILFEGVKRIYLQ